MGLSFPSLMPWLDFLHLIFACISRKQVNHENGKIKMEMRLDHCFHARTRQYEDYVWKGFIDVKKMPKEKNCVNGAS